MWSYIFLGQPYKVLFAFSFFVIFIYSFFIKKPLSLFPSPSQRGQQKLKDEQPTSSVIRLSIFICSLSKWVFIGFSLGCSFGFMVCILFILKKICCTFCKRNSLNVHKCKHKQKTNIRQHNATLGQCRTERETNAQKAKWKLNMFDSMNIKMKAKKRLN